MRVLHVLDMSVPLIAGYTSRSRAIVNAQRRLGVEPVVLTSIRHGDTGGRGKETIDGIQYYRTDKPKPGSRELGKELRYLYKRIVEVARSESVDLIHAHSPILTGVPSWLAARRLGLPCVYEIRSLWEDAAVERGDITEQSLRYRLTRAGETFLANRVDAVCCICDGLKNDLIGRGVSPGKIHLAPNGVETSRFSARSPSLEIQQRFNFVGKTVVGYIGTFFGFEGVVDLVRALAKIIQQGRNDVAGLIVGTGVTYDECHEVAKSYGLADRIVHPGKVAPELVEQMYSVIDVLAYPRRSMRVTELVTPLKPLEAMAMHKAVIGSNVGGIRELVIDEVTGLLHRAGDTDDLAGKILRLVDDGELRRRLGTQAGDWVREKREWASIVANYSPLYTRLLERRHDAS